MVVVCSRCGNANPSDGRYCYFDGSLISGRDGGGPVNVSEAFFAQPFVFASGTVCRNFDQLALGCHENWAEASTALREGILARFLGATGRLDLVALAAQAAQQPDADRALHQFLFGLPSKNLVEARLDVDLTPLEFGSLVMGQNASKTVVLENAGHGLVFGTIRSNCDWLQIDGAPPGRPRLLQFPHSIRLTVSIVGKNLRASPMPLRAELFIETNAGSETIAVSVNVPPRCFIGGPLDGVRTLHELVERVKLQPAECGRLLEGDTIREWYRSNGWAYPVRKPQATGLGAVQQFFESLGLMEPPTVTADTAHLELTGPPGGKIQQTLTFTSDAPRKVVYAVAKSPFPWLQVTPISSDYGVAKLQLDIAVPPLAGMTFSATVKATANGQKFPVKVDLLVEGPAADVGDQNRSSDARDFDFEDATVTTDSASSIYASRVPRRSIGLLSSLFLFLCLLGGGGFAAHHFWPRDDSSGIDVFAAYRFTLPPNAFYAAHIDLVALREARQLSEAMRDFDASLRQSLLPLRLTPPPGVPSAALMMETPTASLVVWTFDVPVQFGKAEAGHFDAQGDLRINRIDAARSYAIDAKGRLLEGPAAELEAILAAEAKERISPAYARLTEREPIEAAPFLAIGNGRRVPLVDILPWLAPMAPLDVGPFHLALRLDPKGAPLLEGSAQPTSADKISAFCESLKNGTFDAIPRLCPELQHAPLIGETALERSDTEVFTTTTLTTAKIRAQILYASQSLADRSKQSNVELAKACQRSIDEAIDSLKAGRTAEAIAALVACTERFPSNGPASAALTDVLAVDRAKKLIREQIDLGQIAEADESLAKLKKLRFGEIGVDALRHELTSAKTNRDFESKLAYGRKAIENDDPRKALGAFAEAAKYAPAAPFPRLAHEGSKILIDGSEGLAEARKLVDAEECRRMWPQASHALFALNAPHKIWSDAGFKGAQERMTKQWIGEMMRARSELLFDSNRKQAEAATAASENDFLLASSQLQSAYDAAEIALKIAVDLRKFQKTPQSEEAVASTSQRLGELSGVLRELKEKSDISALERDLRSVEKEYLAAKKDSQKIAPLKEVAAKVRSKADMAKDLKGGDLLVKRAELLLNKADRLEIPFRVDFSSEPLIPKDWQFNPKEWSLRKFENRQWLQAADGPPVTIASPVGDWPSDFIFSIEFSLLAENKIDNTRWKGADDPLQIKLESVIPGLGLEIKFGQKPDTGGLGQKFRVLVGDQAIFVGELRNKTDPVRFKIVSKDGLTFQVNDERPVKLDAPTQFQQARITVANAYRNVTNSWFLAPVIHRVSVQSATLEAGNR